MNINPVISLPVSADLSAYSHVGVKLTSTGIALAGSGDRVIGTMIRGNAVAANTGDTVIGRSASVQLATGTGLHFITIANSTAIAMGDELEQWPNGRYGKRGGVITGTGEADDDLITIAGHGLTAGTPLTLVTGTGGAGLTVGTTYYVIATGLTADVFSVAATAAGSAVNISTDYSVLSFRLGSTAGAAGIAVDSAPASNIGGQINALLFASSPSDGIEVLTVARTLTTADSGKTFFLALAGGFTVTLPATASSAGCRFTFIAKVSPTTAYIITSAGGSSGDDIVGWPSNIGGADSVADGNAAGDLLNFVANTALAGDMAEFFCDGTFWYVRAHAKAINALTITG